MSFLLGLKILPSPVGMELLQEIAECLQQKSKKAKAYYVPCMDRSSTNSGALAIPVAYIVQSPVL